VGEKRGQAKKCHTVGKDFTGSRKPATGKID